MILNVIFQPGVFSIPYPYWHQQNLPITTPQTTLTANALYQLDLLLAQQTSPANTAAIIVEPVLGEGGYVPAPPEFLQGLRSVCDKHGIMLIVDEVQSGFGRTGSWFSIEESGVKPDILVMAKVGRLNTYLVLLQANPSTLQGLGNGFPISGVVSRRELTDTLTPGSMVCLRSLTDFHWVNAIDRAGHMPATLSLVLPLLQLRTSCVKTRFLPMLMLGTCCPELLSVSAYTSNDELNHILS